MSKLKIAVMASGSGTNLQSIIDNCLDGIIDAKIVVLISDNPDAFALVRAQRAGIETRIVNPNDYPSKDVFNEAMADALRSYNADLLILAGYMRLVSKVILDCFPQRVINIHPALLPSFTGLKAQQQALEYGVKFSGCTVHFVDEGMDTGRIIAQAVVPVLSDDTVETLMARILIEEHKLYPYVVGKFAENKIITDASGSSRQVFIED